MIHPVLQIEYLDEIEESYVYIDEHYYSELIKYEPKLIYGEMPLIYLHRI